MENVINENIHLNCFHGPTHNGARIYPVRNPITGEYPSCVRKVNSHGDIIYQNGDDPGEYFVKETDSFYIKQGTEFDLTNDIQRKNWDAIRFSDLIFDEKGKYDDNGNEIVPPSDKAPFQSLFYVQRIVDEAKKRNTAARLKNKALNFIYQDSDTGLALKAKILGCYVKSSTREEIEEYVVNVAQTNPQQIIDLYTGSDMKLHLIFLYAKEKNILINKAGMYTYADTNFIGRNADECVRYFKQPENKVITDRIIRELTDVLKEVNETKKSDVPYELNQEVVNKIENIDPTSEEDVKEPVSDKKKK